MPLTDIKLKQLKANNKPYKEYDGEGLYIYVSPTGSKTWRIRYRFEKKEQTYTIGTYPKISLKDARQKLSEVKTMLAQGINPMKEKLIKTALQEKNTFEKIVYEWIEKQNTRWGERYRRMVEYRMDHYVFGFIGQLDVNKISAKQVLEIIRRIEERGKTDMAHRVLVIISQAFRYAVACGLCESDPCRDLKGALTFHKSTPRAALTDPKEVGQLMRNIKAYPAGTMREAMLWSAYTFCRPIEVRQAEWCEIDFERRLWIIPAEKMKMRREHRVPLSNQCFEVLENQRGFDKKWIFPSVRKGKCLSENGVLSAIRSMGYEKDQMCAHGFRAMASTLLNELGYRPDIIESSLAHVDDNKVRAVYNRAEYMEERRKMMQEWADYLDNLAE